MYISCYYICCPFQNNVNRFIEIFNFGGQSEIKPFDILIQYVLYYTIGCAPSI